MPDNSAIRRKMAAQGGNRVPDGLNGLGAFGDYPAVLPYRVLSTKGGAGQQGGALDQAWGPVTAPTIPGEDPDSQLGLLRDIADYLRRLPEAMLLALRTQLVLTPREAVSFIALSGTVSIPAGAAVAVVSQAIQPRFAGFITKVGVSVLPTGSFPDITWQLRVNGAIHPEFSNRIFSASTLGDPDDFVLELVQGRTVQLVAMNTSGVAIDVQGKLVGWTEFLTDNKPYGSSSMAGIS